MTQYKQWIFNKELSETQRRRVLVTHSTGRNNTEFFLRLPQNCPRSHIVYSGETDSVEVMAAKIYRKYVATGAPYEINVDWQTRYELSRLIETIDWGWREQHDDLVNL